jgi:D-aminopeptidase
MAAGPPTVANGEVVVAPAGGLLRNLVVNTDVAVATADMHVVVSVNGVDSALDATVAIGAHAGSDLAHTVTVARGDLLSLHVPTSTFTGAADAAIGFELIPT